jgi:hypothetical protein
VGGASPSPFTIYTIKYKVAMYDPAERADILPLFLLHPYMYSKVTTKKSVPGSTLFSLYISAQRGEWDLVIVFSCLVNKSLSQKLKSRYGARNRFQESSLEMSSQDSKADGPERNPIDYWFLWAL